MMTQRRTIVTFISSYWLTTVLPPVVTSLQFGVYFPFGTEVGDKIVTLQSADNCSVPIDIPFTIFSHTQLYVCLYGIVTFGGIDPPQTSPLEKIPRRHGALPTIAGKWYYYNNPSGGQVFYRTSSDDETLLQLGTDVVRLRNRICAVFTDACNFTASWTLLVTWYQLTPNRYNLYLSRHTYTFQLLLTSDSVHHYIVINNEDYSPWESIKTSGYDVGDGLRYFNVDWSEESWTDTPGRWIYRELETFNSSSVRVRLAGSSHPRTGRLEVLYDGYWGTVCDDYQFSDDEAKVVCNMLGYGYMGNVRYKRFGDDSHPMLVTGVECDGTETNIAQCKHRMWGMSAECTSSREVHVRCSPSYDLTFSERVQVRLAGNSSSEVEGRVEVQYNGTWGTVCADDGQDNSAVSVICYALGFKRAGSREDVTKYGHGSGKIWLSEYYCDDRHFYAVGECIYADWGHNNCTHDQDLAVACQRYSRFADDLPDWATITLIVLCCVALLVIMCLCVGCRLGRRRGSHDEPITSPAAIPLTNQQPSDDVNKPAAV